MQMIYDSEAYVVMQMNAPPFDHPFLNLDEPVIARAEDFDPFKGKMLRQGFEIVDKRTGKEVYLDGSWAEFFQEKLNGWQRQAPTIEEIEKTLEGYAALATQPIMVH
ncbi:MAG: DUF3567 domain-containing protein [Cytophagales bacterium]|nr:DUF3567 domain-containing protein [Cytophagales bacterium]